MLFTIRIQNILVSTLPRDGVKLTDSLAKLSVYSHNFSKNTSGNTNDRNESDLRRDNVPTPRGKLDIRVTKEDTQPNKQIEVLKPFPNNSNPHTGEVGGPRGPEPTRYGDWERKGRVSDF